MDSINKSPIFANSYSCSNVYKPTYNQIGARNFFFMTLKELEEYWNEMDEKIERNKSNKYKVKEIDSCEFLPEED